MNRAVYLVLLTLFVKFSFAQQYEVHGTGSDLYLTHNVAAKETWFSIGRTYNLSPREIAAYNKANLEKTLEIGQQLRIPLKSANFTQNDSKARDEVLVPLYHTVQDKEWMYRVSVNHNKVPIERIEKWNSISRNEVKAGMKLIVGHLKVKQENAQLSASNATPASATKAPTTTPSTSSTQPAATTQTATTTGGATSAAATSGISGGGYFKNQFASTGKTQTVVAGIFKSTSGWNDGKYYALINNVTVGTIIKITYAQTGKSVFAKVLGELPEMKESVGLGLRISDAAANELGAVSSKFSVDVER